MKLVIWKFSLSLSVGRQEFVSPGVMRPRYFAMQNDRPCMWVEVMPEMEEKTARGFYVVGTGHTIPENTDYVGSTLDGGYVWHLYVEKEHLIRSA